jgi:hypothetical protein
MLMQLPMHGLPAELMLHTWLQVQEQVPSRTLDKNIARDAAMLQHWEACLSASDQEDAQVLTKLLRWQVAEDGLIELSEKEADMALRACSRCRVYLQSPWLDISLPTVMTDKGKALSEAELVDALMDWFMLITVQLIEVQNPGLCDRAG